MERENWGIDAPEYIKRVLLPRAPFFSFSPSNACLAAYVVRTSSNSGENKNPCYWKKKKTCLRLISYPDFTLSYFETSGYEKKHLIFNPFPLKITLITNSQNV